MSRTVLKDICAEAIELLKDKPVATAALSLFKHVKPLRQIEMAELMNRMGNYGKAYAARARVADEGRAPRRSSARPKKA